MLIPSGCGWCSIPERGHCQRWSSPYGWHRYEPPTQALIKSRMLFRRALTLDAARAAVSASQTVLASGHQHSSHRPPAAATAPPAPDSAITPDHRNEAPDA